jgi:ABC-type antimicrobial peptide transport system permease subunit
MISNYLLIALRNVVRYKGYSFLNIFGLAIGLMASIFIMLWVNDELSYDRFHANHTHLYRLISGGVTSGEGVASTMAPIPIAMKEEIPEVAAAVRLARSENAFDYKGLSFKEKNIFYADANFLSVFKFPLLKGNVETALASPDGLVLTQATAIKYFGNEEALGKTLLMDDGHLFMVKGVLQDIPSNSHLQFDFLLPMAYRAQWDGNLIHNRWGNFSYYNYILLKESLTPSKALLERIQKQTNEIFIKNNTIFGNSLPSFLLQPVTEIHLNPNLENDLAGHGDRQYVTIFSAVAVFILLIAAINFMNLSTARSARRAKEVGLRKVVGAIRSQLISQFLGESILFTLIAFFLAMALVLLLLPAFNSIVDKQLTWQAFDGTFLLGLLGIVIVTGLLAGSYPAWYLSAFEPAGVLKGTHSSRTKTALLRHSLVVVQFSISILLLVGTAIVYRQIEFIHTQNLGFNKENLLYVSITKDMRGNIEALRSELQANPLTKNFSFTNHLPTDLTTGTIMVDWEGKDPLQQIVFPNMAVDDKFIETFNMQLLHGRSFSKEFNDTTNYIVNETALKVMGMEPAKAVGKPLSYEGRKGSIIGVVKDFNFKPLQQKIEPLILELNRGRGLIVVRAQVGKTEQTIKELEAIHQKFNSAYPFEYNFLDQDFENLYRTEKRMGTFANIFSTLTIITACLGLFGLAAFTAQQRGKEISIRKVLGASVPGIFILLSKDFIKLVLISILIASPIAWYVMNQWLENYVYHIEMSLWVFALAGLLVIGIALLTVSFQAVKAAFINPIKGLRNE